jgi:hypothetical protein
MSSILRDLHNSVWFRFNEISIKYDDWKPIPLIIHNQFHALIKQYLDLAMESLRNDCDKLKKQYEDSLELYRTAKEIFADCPASRSDEIRSSLYTNVKRLGQLCGRLQGRWIKCQHHYENEYERIEKTLPKCPRCEDEFEEETERMREAYYRDMKEKYECECSDYEDDY